MFLYLQLISKFMLAATAFTANYLAWEPVRAYSDTARNTMHKTGLMISILVQLALAHMHCSP